MGTAETRETYYRGTFPRKIQNFQSKLIFNQCIFFLPAVRYLYENEVYSFQVFSLSTTDYQAGSNEYDIRVPPYIRTRWIAIGCTLLIILTFIFAALFIYYRKRLIKPLYPDVDSKLQRG